MRRRRTFWSDKACDAYVEEVVVVVVEMGGGERLFHNEEEKRQEQRKKARQVGKGKVHSLRIETNQSRNVEKRLQLVAQNIANFNQAIILEVFSCKKTNNL